MLKLTKYAHDSIPLLEVIIYLLCSYEEERLDLLVTSIENV